MTDDDIHSFAPAYALDALSSDEVAQFEAHLDDCPWCSAEVASFRSTLASLADDVEEAPPATLREAVLAGIQVGPTSEASTPPTNVTRLSPGELRQHRKAPTAWLAVAAAVLAVAVVGAGWRAVSLQTQVSDLSAAAATLTQVLTSPDARTVVVTSDSGARASVVVSASEDRAVLLTQDMEPAPNGSTYQAWFIGADGNITSAGVMSSATASGTLLAGSPDGATAVGVTVEPEGGSEQPTSEPVMVIDLDAAASA